MSSKSAFAAVAKTLQYLHGDAAEDATVIITRVGGTATPTDATIYRERNEHRRQRSEYRNTTGDQENFFTRKVILPPGTPPVPISSVLSIDGLIYTVDSSSTSRVSGSITLATHRGDPNSVSRPGYYGRS